MDYKFKSKFTVADNGKMVDATNVSISAPTNKVCEFVANLDSEFSSALMSLAQKKFDNQDNSDEKKEISADQIVMLMSSDKADLKKCYYSLREIMKQTAKINSTIDFTDVIFDKMSYDDTKKILGEYIKSFLFTSHQG